MNNPRTRSVIVEFDATVTDIETALVRNGLQMFRGVKRVIPVSGTPTDTQARNILAKDKMAALLAAAEQRRDELASRIDNAQAAMSGPIPLPDWPTGSARANAGG